MRLNPSGFYKKMSRSHPQNGLGPSSSVQLCLEVPGSTPYCSVYYFLFRLLFVLILLYKTDADNMEQTQSMAPLTLILNYFGEFGSEGGYIIFLEAMKQTIFTCLKHFF